jgi:hypothetical protein
MSDARHPKVRSALQDRLILAAWILGLFLVGALLWIGTGPWRTSRMLQEVNHQLEKNGLDDRVELPLGTWGVAGRSALAGFRFSLAGNNGTVFVFSMPLEGNFAAGMAMVSKNGGVGPLLPLGEHASILFERSSPELIGMFAERVENAASLLVREAGKP